MSDLADDLVVNALPVPVVTVGPDDEIAGARLFFIVIAAGSISTPTIVGSMNATSGTDSSTGRRWARSSARIRRPSRISMA